MEIYASKLSMPDELSSLLWRVESILGDESLKFDDYWRVFEKRRGLSLNAISKLLRDKGLIFEDKDLYLVLQILLANYKRIVRNEYWDKETEYEYLDRILWEHRSQEVHYSFVDDCFCEKRFLMISDTHIGNDKLFNSKLLHNIYDYAIKNGAAKCFHMGDLFEGCHELLGNFYDLTPRKVDAFEKDFCRQVNLFKNEYPKTNLNEFKTYCLIGNHDEAMDRFLKYRNWCCASDLRKISIYNPSFYMFPRSHWCTKLNGRDFHFNHRLYMSAIIEDLRINKLGDIDDKKEIVGNLIFDSHYDVFVSGHLHKGIIYTESDYFKEKDNLYLGVPSASNINIGGAVGYLVYMYPECNCMEISVLGCNGDLSVYEMDRITWEFGKKNKSYCRTL